MLTKRGLVALAVATVVAGGTGTAIAAGTGLFSSTKPTDNAWVKALATRLGTTPEKLVEALQGVSNDRIDALVNNSGIAHGNPLERESDADWNDVIATNLTGARNVAVEVARHMIAAGSVGSIVNIASILGLRQGLHVSAYATSKAGLVQLTRQMALEWARHRIRVNALAPGYIDTPINGEYLNSEAGKAMIKRIPQRRIGRLEYLDGPLLLLLSDASAYMTGAIIPVDGGHLLTPL